MGSREIRSPESLPEKSPSAATAAEVAVRRKLASYFVESEGRRTPAEILGGDYVVGTTPVNIRGKPIEDLSKTGGWIAAFFIFGLKEITDEEYIAKITKEVDISEMDLDNDDLLDE